MSQLLDNLIPPCDVMREAMKIQAKKAKPKPVAAIPVTEAECAAAEPLVEIQSEVRSYTTNLMYSFQDYQVND